MSLSETVRVELAVSFAVSDSETLSVDVIESVRAAVGDFVSESDKEGEMETESDCDSFAEEEIVWEFPERDLVSDVDNVSSAVNVSVSEEDLVAVTLSETESVSSAVIVDEFVFGRGGSVVVVVVDVVVLVVVDVVVDVSVVVVVVELDVVDDEVVVDEDDVVVVEEVEGSSVVDVVVFVSSVVVVVFVSARTNTKFNTN